MYTPTSVKYCDCYYFNMVDTECKSLVCIIRHFAIYVFGFFEKHIGDLMINNPFFDKNCKKYRKTS